MLDRFETLSKVVSAAQLVEIDLVSVSDCCSVKIKAGAAAFFPSKFKYPSHILIISLLSVSPSTNSIVFFGTIIIASADQGR
jgi:hypothetical protein